MKRLLLAMMALGVSAAGAAEGRLESVKPTQAHLSYHNLEMIGLIHWGPNSFTDQDWGFGNTPPSVVTPDKLNPEQWVTAMKAGGLKGVILVCKHHDGFCLWPSKYNQTYSMAAVPAPNKGFDVVKATADACRRHGLKFGAYLSPWDRHQGSYGTPEYVEYFHNQWDELMTNYGPLFEIWLDGANGGTGWYGGVNGDQGERRRIPDGYYQMDRLHEKMHKLHSEAVAFGIKKNWCVKWCLNEFGTSPLPWWNPSKGEDGRLHWLPSEADTPFRRKWFYNELDRPKSLRKLIDAYFATVGHGATLNLGIAPDRHGLVPHADTVRLKEFGDYVHAFNALDFSAAAGTTRTMSNDGLNCVMDVRLPQAVRFNCVDIREQFELGQRVESFVVEVEENGAWRKVASSSTVGVRRLVRFDDVVSAAVRVTLKGRAEKPLMKPLAIRFAPLVSDDTRPVSSGNGNWKILDDADSLTIDMGAVVGFTRFDYLPGQKGCAHGLIDAYTLEGSRDGTTWTLIKRGEFDNILANPVPTSVCFPLPQWARYIRFKATHRVTEGAPGYCAREFAVFEWN